MSINAHCGSCNRELLLGQLVQPSNRQQVTGLPQPSSRAGQHRPYRGRAHRRQRRGDREDGDQGQVGPAWRSRRSSQAIEVRPSMASAHASPAGLQLG